MPDLSKYLGLLRWSLQYQDGTRENVQPMSEERKKWLFEAIESQVVDPVKQMKNVLMILQLDPIFSEADTSMDQEFYGRQEQALEEILDYIDNFDLARDFQKIGGLDIILKLIQKGENEASRVYCLEVISRLVQNHPELQKRLVESNGLEILIEKISTSTSLAASATEDLISSSIAEQAKAVGAIGSLVRGNEEISQEFLLKHKALPHLFQLIDSHKDLDEAGVKETTEKCRIVRKSLFLVKYFVDSSEGVREPIRRNFLEVLKDVHQKVDDVDATHLSQQIIEILSSKS